MLSTYPALVRRWLFAQRDFQPSMPLMQQWMRACTCDRVAYEVIEAIAFHFAYFTRRGAIDVPAFEHAVLQWAQRQEAQKGATH